jgi:primosomal protein N' (replication factor Y)
MLYAEVAVHSTFPHRQTFSYGVPDGMPARPGMAAYVPFGKLTLQGIIVEVHDTPMFSEPEKIRELRSLIGDEPVLDADRLATASWIAEHYLAPIFDALALFLPPGFERRPVTTLSPLIAGDEIDTLDLTPRQRETLTTITSGRARDMEALRSELKFGSLDAIIVQLERRGLVERQYTLARPRITAKTVDIATLALPLAEALARIDEEAPRRASRRAAVLERLIARRSIATEEAARIAGSRANLERLLRAGAIRHDREGHNVELAMSPDEARAEIAALTALRRTTLAVAVARALADAGEMTFAEIRAATGADTDAIRWLGEIAVVTISERGVERDPLAHFAVVPRAPAELLAAQTAAARSIIEAVQAHRYETFLLHGVTGSGKTEVYLAALDACVAAGRRGIVMVPEIALTPQTIRRFRERFERVAVLHSGLTDGELFDSWHGIAAGRYDVVIGARSAIFAPQPDLGLVIIDEEHEWTYKQSEPSPRYHARDVAVELALRKQAAVVLGSATPDVGTYEAAQRGVHRLLDLPERIRPVVGADGVVEQVASLAMPRIDVVDLREELKAGNRGMFSALLTQAIGETLAADNQAILFLNRRGLAGHVQCRDCGFVPECTSCAVALTYHKQYDRLVCHQCNRHWRLPARCKQCGSPRVRLLGVGVEKVEQEAARAFPHARLLRWDRDVTRTRGAHDRILAAFLAHEADILIGTQMVAKGLDMPGVTLVGVVNADMALHLPDFRAGERTFQLLTQVAGRAGRGERPGRVIIQTYTPDHYAIDAASCYDYLGFAGAELEYRERLGYPPYRRLARLLLAQTNPRTARDEAMRLGRALAHRRSELGSETEITGPSPAYVQRLRGRWRWQLLLRGRDPADLVRGFVLPPDWTVDVDPASLL